MKHANYFNAGTLEKLFDEVHNVVYEERCATISEKNKYDQESPAFWYCEGKINGMDWVVDTLRLTIRKLKEECEEKK